MSRSDVDYPQIVELYATYCRELDIGSPAVWAGCFVKDGTFQRVNGDEVLIEVKGRDALRQFAAKVHDAEARSVRRWPTNVIVGGEDETLQGSSYLTMVKVIEGEKEEASGRSSEEVPVGLYTGNIRIVSTSTTVDTLTLTPSGWRFALRRVRVDQD